MILTWGCHVAPIVNHLPQEPSMRLYTLPVQANARDIDANSHA
jgi:hypothetical protein